MPKQKRINIIFCVIYGIISIVAGILHMIPFSFYFMLLTAVSFLLLSLPWLANRIFHLKPVYEFHFMVYIFCFFAFVIGMLFQGYHTIPLYDKAVHCLSGIFFSFIGVVFFYLLKPEKRMLQEDYPLLAAFAFTFSMAIAAVWEIYEYIINFILKTDPQNVLTTGVNDTMLDIISCLIGTLFMEISIFFYYKKQKRGCLMKTAEKLIRTNFYE